MPANCWLSISPQLALALTWLPLVLQGFEPYVIVARKFVPWYDERFKG